VLPPDGEPEPDGAIIVAAADDYRGRKPGAADVRCVIEGADSSLEHDRTTKLQVYARAGIPQYVIINLVDRVVEVFREPHAAGSRYAQMATLAPGQTVEFSCGDGKTVAVPVDRLLP
jgi:Uma2 family endonuclease